MYNHIRMTITTVELADIAESLHVLSSRLTPTKKMLRKLGLRVNSAKTLQILSAGRTMIVGDIQKTLNILPAAMSRLIRELENRETPLIRCTINIRDKRKVDVELTSAGENMVQKLQSMQGGALEQCVETADLRPRELEILSSTLLKLRAVLSYGRAKQEENGQE